MSIIRKMRKQKAVYWKRLTPDRFGSFTYDDPIEIDCRWDDQLGEFRNAQGQTLASKAVVFVDREMFLGDKLQKGAMESDTPDDPSSLSDAFEIQAFEQNPNLKNTETLYTAHL